MRADPDERAGPDLDPVDLDPVDLDPVDLDPVIHAPARLRLVAGLAALDDGDRLAFSRLQQLQGLTAGNLGAHLRKLEDAGYVAVEKTYRGRTPVTWVCLTRRGRQALEDHTAALRALLEPVTARPSVDDARRS